MFRVSIRLLAKERVVVLCTGNSCRSHMAEGLINKFLGSRYEAVSAGTKPTGYVHPLAIKALAEVGADISNHHSKHTDDIKGEYELAITVCDNALQGKPEWLDNSVHISFEDPADATGSEEEQLAVFRAIRDQIKDKIVPFLSTRTTSSQKRFTSTTTLESVQDYYGKVLNTNKDLKTTACTAAGRPPLLIRDIIKTIPKEVNEKFYGCGTPIPTALSGLTVLDLGSGSGRDAYIASALAGSAGKVIGIDMTDEQLEVAKRHVDEFSKTLGHAPNMTFQKGYIEDIRGAGVQDGTVDMVLSNCVINLSPDKPAVLQGAYDCLKVGGELYFSDVYCDRRLPQEARDNEVLWGECISGALYIEDFIRESQKVGFADPRVLEVSEIVVQDPELANICGNARFYSITYRLFKLPEMLETKCEDYGQYALYKGTIPGSPHTYVLDDHHVLEKNKPFLVCGNTAAMLGEDGVSWLSPHFEIVGDRSVHYGLFDCSPVASASSSAPAPSPGGCC
eukprot:TRINITY_DN2137_c2_g6_i1.p1 TRINITY_DN2137_c2_g6~~TRINITY_DN2137_c2_g6_i1.p1  ORF type:complete len:507 (+),score=144.54 TRINITY_DN2137_c2_g6_i1:59-1579(+)